jgi:hypothetical protein
MRLMGHRRSTRLKLVEKYSESPLKNSRPTSGMASIMVHRDKVGAKSWLSWLFQPYLSLIIEIAKWIF